MLKNDPELIPGLKGEAMPTIRNTKGIEKARHVSEIRCDKDWTMALRIYATQHSMTLDQAMDEEALHIINGEPLLREGITFDTAAFIQMKKEEIRQQWLNSPQQVQLLQEKAKQKGRPFDTVLKQDIQWVIDRQIENGELFK